MGFASLPRPLHHPQGGMVRADVCEQLAQLDHSVLVSFLLTRDRRNKTKEISNPSLESLCTTTF
jgi:hypothetical protein